MNKATPNPRSNGVRLCDAIVVGDGLAGFSAALALKQKGKSVVIVSSGAGATSVSSGAWDFGPTSKGRTSLEDLCISASWKDCFAQLLVDYPLPPKAEELRVSTETLIQALSSDLKLTCHWDQPVWLPSTCGTLRSVFVAQSSQTVVDFANGKFRRIAVVGSPQWRFRGDLLCRQWTGRCKTLGLLVEFRPGNLALEGSGWDIPLPRVAAQLQGQPQAVEKLKASLGQFADSVDAVLLPPIFPSLSIFESVCSSFHLPVSECLASAEPVAGFRLRQAIRHALLRRGIEVLPVRQVKAQTSGDRVEGLTVLPVTGDSWSTLAAHTYVLATGKFFGGGLSATVQKVRENIFNLPVFQDREGQSISDRHLVVDGKLEWGKLGLKVDATFRPLREDGKPAFKNLRACGSVLGGADFPRHQIGLGFFAFTGRQSVTALD